MPGARRVRAVPGVAGRPIDPSTTIDFHALAWAEAACTDPSLPTVTTPLANPDMSGLADVSKEGRPLAGVVHSLPLWMSSIATVPPPKATRSASPRDLGVPIETFAGSTWVRVPACRSRTRTVSPSW